jgi:hypothetical protein
MDPDANLARQLELAQEIIDKIDDGDESAVDKACALAELVLALNEWLARGGFKPKAWEVKPNVEGHSERCSRANGRGCTSDCPNYDPKFDDNV